MYFITAIVFYFILLVAFFGFFIPLLDECTPAFPATWDGFLQMDMDERLKVIGAVLGIGFLLSAIWPVTLFFIGVAVASYFVSDHEHVRRVRAALRAEFAPNSFKDEDNNKNTKFTI